MLDSFGLLIQKLPETTRSSPYSRDFEQNLIDDGIYLNNRSTKPQDR
jgi:hypothetical protein